MNIRGRAALFAAGLLVLAGAFILTGSRTAAPRPPDAVIPLVSVPNRPNVVMVVIDTLRADRLHAVTNGAPVMPHLSQLAKESIECTFAISQCSWTRPSVASIFTSLYADAHGVRNIGAAAGNMESEGDALNPGLETIGTMLKRRGQYTTWGFQTNANLTREFGFAEGFDSYEFSNSLSGNHVTNKALSSAGSLPAPFFMYVHYMDPHAPSMPPEPHLRVFGELPALGEADQRSFSAYHDYVTDRVEDMFHIEETRKFPAMTDNGKDFVRRQYDGECHFVDEEVSRLIEGIKSVDPRTVFVIVADHGEEFWEHGGLGHGTTLHAEQIRVPMIIHGPGAIPRRLTIPVETIDILPTVASLIGLEPNAHWQGRNLLAVANDEVRPVYSSLRMPNARIDVSEEAVIAGSSKLIVHHWNSTVSLFDLIADPGELYPATHGREAQTADLSGLLQDRFVRDEALRKSLDGGQMTQIDKETEEALRAAGYLN